MLGGIQRNFWASIANVHRRDFTSHVRPTAGDFDASIVPSSLDRMATGGTLPPCSVGNYAVDRDLPSRRRHQGRQPPMSPVSPNRPRRELQVAVLTAATRSGLSAA